MTKKDLRIVFLGTPDFAVASLKALVDNGFNIVGVVTAPDKPAGRGMQLKASAVKEYAIANGLHIMQPERLRSKTFLKELQVLAADLQVVVAFRMLPEAVWDMPKLGTINVHASLLPQYRGAAPINWAIINGETKTGVTTFKLKHEIDTGDILLQESLDIFPEDNFGTLYYKLMEAGAKLLVTTVTKLLDNTISEQPQQSVSEERHAPKIFKETGKIDWHQNSEAIHNLIRGLSPIPTAYTFLNEKQLKIFESEIAIERHEKPCGSVDSDGKSYLKFATKDGWVLCKTVQFEGKKKMEIADFLRGFRF